jgi:hypothetical protein
LYFALEPIDLKTDLHLLNLTKLNFQISPEFSDVRSESATLVNYLQGIVNQATCFQSGDDGSGGLQVGKIKFEVTLILRMENKI